MTDDGLRRLALGVLLRTVHDAQQAERLPDWATIADRAEAVAFDGAPWFFRWCRAARANPAVVSRHLRARLPVADPQAIKGLRRLKREDAAARSEHARRAGLLGAARRWGAAA